MEKEITRRHGDKKKKRKKTRKNPMELRFGHFDSRDDFGSVLENSKSRILLPLLLFVCVSRKLFTKSVPTSPDDTLLHNSFETNSVKINKIKIRFWRKI